MRRQQQAPRYPEGGVRLHGNKTGLSINPYYPSQIQVQRHIRLTEGAHAVLRQSFDFWKRWFLPHWLSCLHMEVTEDVVSNVLCMMHAGMLVIEASVHA